MIAPISAGSWLAPEDGHKTLCITQADWSIRWHLNTFHGVTVPEYERRGLQQVDGTPFDVYEAVIPGGRREYWINVSYWFNRGLLFRPQDLNGPPPVEVGSLESFFGEFEFGNLPFRHDTLEKVRDAASKTGLRFMGNSSQQLGNNVAKGFVEDGKAVVEATAVRRFLADSLPLLHGFRFVKPFLMHQVTHLLMRENLETSGFSPKGDYFLPIPGVHCVSFRPTENETPANDFWNYMLWSHRQGAFQSQAERDALTASALTAIGSGFLNARELVETLNHLDVEGVDGEALRDLAKSWLSFDTGSIAARDGALKRSATELSPLATVSSLAEFAGGRAARVLGLVSFGLPSGSAWRAEDLAFEGYPGVILFAADPGGKWSECSMFFVDVTGDSREPDLITLSAGSLPEVDRELREDAERGLPAYGQEHRDWCGSRIVTTLDGLRLLSTSVVRMESADMSCSMLRMRVGDRQLLIQITAPMVCDAQDLLDAVVHCSPLPSAAGLPD